ncbi:Nn.00g117590.m01.CDS01 [Neocucurbitaria sp. VM-36]
MSNQRTGSPSITNDVAQGGKSTKDTAIKLSHDATTSGVAPETAISSLYRAIEDLNNLMKDDPVIKEMLEQRRSSSHLHEFIKVYGIVLQNPNLPLPITQEQYDGILSSVVALRSTWEAACVEREKEKEEKDRKRREKIQDLEKGFLIRPTEDEGTDIPEELVLCLSVGRAAIRFATVRSLSRPTGHMRP